MHSKQNASTTPAPHVENGTSSSDNSQSGVPPEVKAMINSATKMMKGTIN